MIRTELINTHRFIVIERAQMDSILKEQGLQQTGCTDQECAVKAGRLHVGPKDHGRRDRLAGKIDRDDGEDVDVEKGISVYADEEKAATEDDLDGAVARMTQKLAERITRMRSSKEAEKKSLVSSCIAGG